MEWWLILTILLSGMMVLFFTAMPIGLGLLIMSMVGVVWFWGGWGDAAFGLLVLNIRESIVNFDLLPLPLFILMGELLFRTGIAPKMLDALGHWMGRIPGRLSLLAIIAGTLFATMTGASMASIALLGSMLIPEMEKHGYKKDMIDGPIMSGGSLAPMIPPSGLAIFIGVIAQVSIGKMLIAIIVPGLVMAAFFFAYILIRCSFNPNLAPVYRAANVALSTKLKDTAFYILPLTLIIFLVTGVILLGVTSPSEAAATGTMGAVILAVCYRTLTWRVIRESLLGTVELSAMMFLILMPATTFGQILAISGAGSGLSAAITGLHVAPMSIIWGMMILIGIGGCFISTAALMMIFIPLFLPIVKALGFDPIWFCVIFLINCELGGFTPPFGIYLFVMKGVAPKTHTMGDIVHSAVPFMIITGGIIILIMYFPPITLWLPNLMMK